MNSYGHCENESEPFPNRPYLGAGIAWKTGINGGKYSECLMNQSSEGDKIQRGTGRLKGKVAIVTGAACGYVLETGNLALEGKCEDLLTDARVKKAYLGQ